MLVPGVNYRTDIYVYKYSEQSKNLLLDQRLMFSHTSVGFDVLDVSLGVFDLNRRAGDKLLAPATHIVVEVNDAEVIVYGQVIQNSLHGLHRLSEKFGV